MSTTSSHNQAYPNSSVPLDSTRDVALGCSRLKNTVKTLVSTTTLSSRKARIAKFYLTFWLRRDIFSTHQKQQFFYSNILLTMTHSSLVDVLLRICWAPPRHHPLVKVFGVRDESKLFLGTVPKSVEVPTSTALDRIRFGPVCAAALTHYEGAQLVGQCMAFISHITSLAQPLLFRSIQLSVLFGTPHLLGLKSTMKRLKQKAVFPECSHLSHTQWRSSLPQ